MGQAQVTLDPLTRDWLAPYPAPSPTAACIPALPVPGAPRGLGPEESGILGAEGKKIQEGEEVHE